MMLEAAQAQLVHASFEWFALVAGFALYRHERRCAQQHSIWDAQVYPVLLGCLVGAALGNKLVFWIEHPHRWDSTAGWLQAMWAGQSVVGGLLGGWLGVELGKKWAGVRSRTGDDFVRPILLGLFIGRIGCFLAGLHDNTYGIPTELPWGMDFGDGVARHPTQLYELVWVAPMAGAHARWYRRWAQQPGWPQGGAFRALMLSYLLWRWAVDGLKPVPWAYAWGWSGIQWVSFLGALAVAAGMWRDWRDQTGRRLAS